MARLRSAQPRRRALANRHARGYTNDWTRRSKRAVDEWAAANGMVCPGVERLGIEQHSVDGQGSGRLTGNHRTALQTRRALGMPLVDDEPIDVMCQGCNTRLGEAERRELEGSTAANSSCAFRPAEPPVEPWFA